MKPTPLRSMHIDDPFEEIMAQVDQDGGVIVRDFIDAKLLQQLNAELEADIAATKPGVEGTIGYLEVFWGRNTKRFTRLAARVPSFAKLLDHQLMHDWARRNLEGDTYWLNTGQAMIVGPGEPSQFLHRDIGIWPTFDKLGPEAPEIVVSIMLALTDFTEEVGATRVIPGSHKWPDFTVPGTAEQTVPSAMPAGSAMLYLGKTIHGAGANTTSDLWRHALHMSFVRGWLTPEEASPLGVPWSVAKQYPPRVQQMLGYTSFAKKEFDPPSNWLVDFEDARKFLGVPVPTAPVSPEPAESAPAENA